jgi:hypothetical protein
VVVDCDRGTVDTAAARIEALPRKVARSLGRSIRRALLPTVVPMVATSAHTSAVTALTDLDAPARFDAPLLLSTAAGYSAGSTNAGGVSVAGSTAAASEAASAVAGMELPVHGSSSSTDSSSNESAEPSTAAASTAAAAAAVPKAGKAALLHYSATDSTITSSSSSSSSSSWLAAQHTLRMDFVRAMADLLFGYSDCLFFVDPDRPIFNAERFLQEYVREEGVPFLSRVVDTLAFKFLLENQVLAQHWLTYLCTYVCCIYSRTMRGMRYVRVHMAQPAVLHDAACSHLCALILSVSADNCMQQQCG